MSEQKPREGGIVAKVMRKMGGSKDKSKTQSPTLCPIRQGNKLWGSRNAYAIIMVLLLLHAKSK